MIDIKEHFSPLSEVIHTVRTKRSKPKMLTETHIMNVLGNLELGNVRFVGAGTSALILEPEENPYPFPTVIRASRDDMPRLQWPIVLPSLEAVPFENRDNTFKVIERVPLLDFYDPRNIENLDWDYKLSIDNFTYTSRTALASFLNDKTWETDASLFENFNHYNIGFARANPSLLVPFLCETGNRFFTDSSHLYNFGSRLNTTLAEAFKHAAFAKIGRDPASGRPWQDVLFPTKNRSDSIPRLDDFTL